MFQLLRLKKVFSRLIKVFSRLKKVFLHLKKVFVRLKKVLLTPKKCFHARQKYIPLIFKKTTILQWWFLIKPITLRYFSHVFAQVFPYRLPHRGRPVLTHDIHRQTIIQKLLGYIYAVRPLRFISRTKLPTVTFSCCQDASIGSRMS